MKILKLLLSLILTILFVTPTLAIAQENESDVPTTVEYLVTAETANLRSQANTNSSIVDTASKGDSLLVYDEESEFSGWYRVYRQDEEDAFIADFLVERAPVRFYSIEQEPIIVISGRGKSISDVYDIPQGAYRIDATVEDRAFILGTVVIEGDCRDDSILNEFHIDANSLILSGLFISSGCSILFETDNVDGNWTVEIRDLLDVDFVAKALLTIDSGTKISGTGRALTMPTSLPEGVWSISANVEDRAFILYARPLGDCEEESIFNEFDPDATTLEISAVYRSSECVVWWESSNVEGNWTITFEKLR